MLIDLKLAVKRLFRNRTGVAAAALSLLVGVGITLWVFTLLSTAYRGNLGFADDGLVTVAAVGAERRYFLTDTEVSELNASRELFAGTCTIERWPASRRAWMDVVTPGGARRANGAYVTPHCLDVLGVEAALGRAFVAADVTASSRVAVLGHQFWDRHFGGDASVIGTTLRINGESYSVIGVLPSGFVAPSFAATGRLDRIRRTDVWVLQDPAQVAGRPGKALLYQFVGRLAETDAGSRAVADRVNSRLLGSADPSNRSRYAVESVRSAMLGPLAGRLDLLVLLSLLLFAGALANVFLVMLLRINQDQAQVALRAALGAQGAQLWRTAAFEVAILTLLSATAAYLAQIWVHPVWVSSRIALLWGGVPVESSAGLTVVGLAGVAVLAAGVLLSLHVRRRRASALPGSSTITRQRQRGWMHNLLAVQAALGVCVAVPAVGVAWALAQTQAQHEELLRDDVIVAEGWMLTRLADTPEVIIPVQDRLRDAVRRIPGVRSVGFASDVPLAGLLQPNYRVRVDDEKGKRTEAFGLHADPGYFQILGTRLLAGRSFTDADRHGGAGVAVVSSSLALRGFGTTDVVGRTVVWHGAKEIVGVVADQGMNRPDYRDRPTLYIPYGHEPMMRFAIFVELRSRSEAGTVINALHALDADQPFDSIGPMSELFEGALADQILYARLAAILAAAGLLLAVVGIWIVTGHRVQSQRREIAVRFALGASPLRIVAKYMGSQLRVLLLSAVIAVPVAWGMMQRLTHYMAPLQIAPGPPIIGVTGIVIGIGVLI
ncbi:MAG TPA: ABC transporter permease, partial [Vicinamibacterales bacterium]